MLKRLYLESCYVQLPKWKIFSKYCGWFSVSNPATCSCQNGKYLVSIVDDSVFGILLRAVAKMENI